MLSLPPLVRSLQEVAEQLALLALREEPVVVLTLALISSQQVERPRNLSDMALPLESSALQVADFQLL